MIRERAKSAIDLRIVFPDRVLGKPLTAAASLNDAIGPMSFLTLLINS